MFDNPMIGVGLHAVGGAAHGTFYAPLKRVRGWAWESAWLVQGLAAWIVVPIAAAALLGSKPFLAISQAPDSAVQSAFLFGMMWGAGSLTFGLSVRYLGMSLGMAVALGYTVALGTLLPPLFAGQFIEMFGNFGGRLILSGIAVCLFGIAMCGWAGVRREREQSIAAESREKFSILLGFLVASFSGIMSSGFALGVASGQPIAKAALENGSPVLFQNSPVFVVIMAGGFLVNCIWCLYLGVRNRSLGDYIGRSNGQDHSWTGAPERESGTPGNFSRNCLWAGLSGTIWYVGFMLYGMGTTFMGRFDFTSWSIHLAFVITFSTLAGILAREWRFVRRVTWVLVVAALTLLVSSTLLTAIGNQQAQAEQPEQVTYSADESTLAPFPTPDAESLELVRAATLEIN